MCSEKMVMKTYSIKLRVEEPFIKWKLLAITLLILLFCRCAWLSGSNVEKQGAETPRSYHPKCSAL